MIGRNCERCPYQTLKTAYKMIQQRPSLTRSPSAAPAGRLLLPVLGSSSSRSWGRMLMWTTLGLSGLNWYSAAIVS